jgi:hypothetical protein
VGDCQEVFVKLRNVALWCAPVGLVAALLVAAVPVARPAASAVIGPASRLPVCAPGGPSTRAPSSPAGPRTPGACRADGPVLESGVRLTRPGGPGFTPSGYHHLGANTSGTWSGVSGRFSVVHGSVRPRSYDFVAGRFMVKRDLGAGSIAWLEAGWAETGWAGPGRQHIYTFNTNTHSWQFYDQYLLRPGDKIWLDIHSDTDGVWSAWLWWNNRWNLLTAQRLPIGSSAYVEQYVEVHVDDSRPTRVDVPTVTVDNVQLKPAGGGPQRFWRDDVPTLTGTGPGQQQRSGGFCLNWINPYDTWTAGDCNDDDDGGGLLFTKPAPLPAGEAEVVPPSAPASSPAPNNAVRTNPAPISPAPINAAPINAAPAASASPASAAPSRTPTTAPAPVRPRRPGLLGSLLGR